MKTLKVRNPKLQRWLDRWKWYHELIAIVALCSILLLTLRWYLSL